MFEKFKNTQAEEPLFKKAKIYKSHRGDLELVYHELDAEGEPLFEYNLEKELAAIWLPNSNEKWLVDKHRNVTTEDGRQLDSHMVYEMTGMNLDEIYKTVDNMREREEARGRREAA